MQVSIGSVSIAELCAACFPGRFIHYFSYSIIESYLCHSLCYVPHVQLACLVLVSRGSGCREGQTKDCYWVVLELCFHSLKSAALTEDAYAVVLEKRKIRLESEDFELQRREVAEILQRRVKALSALLTPTSRGKPAMYSYRSEKGKPVLVVNPRYGDVLYTVSWTVCNKHSKTTHDAALFPRRRSAAWERRAACGSPA